MKISVVLATFNEEKNIKDCLESVKGLADEIVIVDGSSTDRTVEIAKKYGARVIVTDNPPIFHINKQKAIDAAKGEWILQLDADERVTPELANELRKLVTSFALRLKHLRGVRGTPRTVKDLPATSPQRTKSPAGTSSLCGNPSRNNQPVAYCVPRKNFFLGRWMKYGGMYPDPVIRFFKRGKAYLPCKSVHEQMKVNGKVGRLKGHLLHYTAPTFSRYLTNSNRYTSLTAQEYADQNLPINFFTTIIYIIVVPLWRFLSLFFRHKGFLDGFPGFVFALYSGLHLTTSYIKYWEKKNATRL